MQKREVASGSRFWTSKNAPGFGPLGPEIVTLDEIADPYDLWMTCAVNGEERMQTITITKINEKEMSTKDKDGKTVELKKTK